MNFLKRLLDPNPHTRIKSEEIFNHPYLLNYYDIFMANNELSYAIESHHEIILDINELFGQERNDSKRY